MVERLSVQPALFDAEKMPGLYHLANGRWFWVQDGVLFLSVHDVPTGVVLGKNKELVWFKHKDGTALVFMQAADVIAAWPHLEKQVKSTARELGLRCG